MPARRPYQDAEQQITPGTTTREQVRKILGEPWFSGDQWDVDIYRQDAGTIGLAGILPLPSRGALYSLVIVYRQSGVVDALGSDWVEKHYDTFSEKPVVVGEYTFDPNVRWLSIAAPGKPPHTFITLTGHGRIQSIATVQQAVQETRKRAEKGDAASQFALYRIADAPERFVWLCRAADQGYAAAQLELGRLYWKGLKGVKQDSRWAYAWYSLAAQGGYKDWEVWELPSLTSQMTPRQLSQAQQMLAEWEPGQCERELTSRSSQARGTGTVARLCPRVSRSPTFPAQP